MSRIYRMRRAVYYCAGGLLVMTFIPHAAPSILVKNCELPGSAPPDDLVRHVRKIASALELAHPERVKVFISSGFSSVSGGCTLLPRGAVIGLPRTVLYRGEADVKQSGMLLEGAPVDWESSAGSKLAHLLSPSTQSTNFRIAHEVEHLKNFDLLPITFHKRHLMTASFPILFSLSLVLYVQLSTSVRHWQEYRADRGAAFCHSSYAQGGVELMKNHMELDALLRRPPSKYSLQHFLSQFSSHPPFSERLRRLEALNSLRNST